MNRFAHYCTVPRKHSKTVNGRHSGTPCTFGGNIVFCGSSHVHNKSRTQTKMKTTAIKSRAAEKKKNAIKSRADSYTHTGCSYSTPQPEDDTNRRAPRTIFIYPPHSVAINSLMSAWRVRLAACAKIIAILAFDRYCAASALPLFSAALSRTPK